MKLTVETIREAMKGNPLAIDQVLLHFDKYLSTCATLEGYDEHGCRYSFVDSELKGHLQSKLVLALPKFRVEGA